MNPLVWKVGSLMIDAVLAGVERSFLVEEVKKLEEEGKTLEEISDHLQQLAHEAVRKANDPSPSN